jgi:hypothetical protein
MQSVVFHENMRQLPNWLVTSDNPTKTAVEMGVLIPTRRSLRVVGEAIVQRTIHDTVWVYKYTPPVNDMKP